MLISISAEVKKEIAQWLDTGMLVYYQIETGEIVTYPDEDRNPHFEAEMWKDEIETVKKNRRKYILFEAMDNRQALKIMRAYTGEISSEKIRAQFENILNERKPFQHFKAILLNYPSIRDAWFAYKEECNIKWVKQQMEAHNLNSA